MRNLLLITLALFVIGAIAFVLPLSLNGWDFSLLNSQKCVENTYEIDETFGGVSISVNESDITIATTDDGTARAEIKDRESVSYSVRVIEGILTVSYTEEKRWSNHIFNFGGYHPEIKLFIPGGEYSSLSIENDTGNVSVPEDITLGTANVSLTTGDISYKASTAGDVTVKASTGDITVSDCTLGSLTATATTGRIGVYRTTVSGEGVFEVSTGDVVIEDSSFTSVSSVGRTSDLSVSGGSVTEELQVKRTTGNVKLSSLVVGSLSVKCSTGDVLFDNFDAIGEITVELSTGSVTGTIASEKIFIPRSGSGRIDVPETATGAICRITTTTGNIKIGISETNQ